MTFHPLRVTLLRNTVLSKFLFENAGSLEKADSENVPLTELLGDRRMGRSWPNSQGTLGRLFPFPVEPTLPQNSPRWNSKSAFGGSLYGRRLSKPVVWGREKGRKKRMSRRC